jgi:hypothetical protein
MAAVDVSLAATFTAIAAYLKEDYTVHSITEQINREAVLFGQMRRNGKDVRGEYAVIPLLTQGARNAVGSRDETDDLPSPGRQTTVTAQLRMRYNTGRLTVTEKAIQSSANADGSFEQVTEVETRGLIADMAQDISRQVFGDGTGKLFRVRSTTSPIQIDFPGGNRCYPDGSDAFGSKYLEVNDIIKFYSSVGVERNESRQITAIDRTVTPNTISLTVPTGLAIGDFGYKSSKIAGGPGTVDDNKDSDMEGLRLIIDDAAQYLTVNADGTWSAAVSDFSLAPVDVSEKLLNQKFSQVERRSQKVIDIEVTTFSLRNVYAESLSLDKRYTNTTTLPGGYTAITHNGKPILVDKDAPPGHWYFLSQGDLYVYNQGGFYWFDRDSFWSRIPDKMAWEATLLYFANSGSPRRNRFGVLRGLNEVNAII